MGESFITYKEHYICSKSGEEKACGDYIFTGKHFAAVIDGATPKGNRLWNGKAGDSFVSELIGECINHFPKDISVIEALNKINDSITREYERINLSYDDLPYVERLQASVLIYSNYRKEIWNYGDCTFLINDREYRNTRKGDILFSELRAFSIALKQNNNELSMSELSEYGRNSIIPFLKEYPSLANTDGEYGYPAINGGIVNVKDIEIVQVKPGNTVVLASDGYPKVFCTLEETEIYLQKCLKVDPMCIDIIKGTKGVANNNVSYDDRCYIKLIV